MGLIECARRLRARNENTNGFVADDGFCFYDKLKNALATVSTEFCAGKIALLAPGWNGMAVMAFPVGFDMTTVRRFLIPEKKLEELTADGFFVFSADADDAAQNRENDFSPFFSMREWNGISGFAIYPSPDKTARFYLLVAGSGLTPGKEKLNTAVADGTRRAVMQELADCLPFIKICAARLPKRKTKQTALDHMLAALDSGKTGYSFKMTAPADLFDREDEPVLTEAFYSALADEIGSSHILVNRTYTPAARGGMEFVGVVFSSSALDIDSYAYFLLKPMEKYFAARRMAQIEVTEGDRIVSPAQAAAFTDSIFNGL